MSSLLITVCLLAQPPAAGGEVAPADKLDALRAEYLADAKRYEFHHDMQRQHELVLAEKPIMRWANDDDWSGDVFIWTYDSRPEVIGCILSGPSQAGRRLVFHEFHLLADQPIAPVDLQTGRRWQPDEGLALLPVPSGPRPAETAAGRLTQMRQIAREFTAHMQADGSWELRLLPQPLFRYGEEGANVVDGALFTYVWTKGTDPEVVLLLECRKADEDLAWHFAPVRFSNRPVWLEHQGKEVWSAQGHQEPQQLTSQIYTTAYARTMSPPLLGAAPDNGDPPRSAPQPEK
jgi:hypothetical protein